MLVVVLGAVLVGQEFEVVSVRPAAPDVVPATLRGATQGFRQPPGRFVAENWSLQSLIAHAYALPRRSTGEVLRLRGGDTGLLARGFHVDARLSTERVSVDEERAMLRALLAERFGLRVHIERQRAPVYALRRDGELGPGLQRSDLDCVTWQRERLPEPVDADGNPLCTARGGFAFAGGGFAGQRIHGQGDIPALIEAIRGYVDRQVLDETGLAGHFTWDVTFTPAFGGVETRAGDASPDVFTAVQERLHLELAPTEAEVNVVVIDAASLPQPN